MGPEKMSESKIKKMFFSYKKRPLVRSGDLLYYGNMNDGFVVKMRVKDTKRVKDLDVSGKISVQLIDTDPSTPPEEKVIRASEKEGLYQALDVATAWLEKYKEMQ